MIPVAIFLMAGGVGFGQLFSAYGTAEKSMRDAARYLARVPQANLCDWGRDNARNLAMYGALTNTGQPLISTWTDPTTVNFCEPGNPTCPPDNCPAPSDVIELRAAVPYAGLWSVGFGFSNSRTLNVKHQERHIGE